MGSFGPSATSAPEISWRDVYHFVHLFTQERAEPDKGMDLSDRRRVASLPNLSGMLSRARFLPAQRLDEIGEHGTHHPERASGEACWPSSASVESTNAIGLDPSWALVCAGCASEPKQFPVIEVSPGIFEGYKPRTRADFQALKASGVRTILSLQQMPWDVWPEARQARENGLEYRDVPILASPLPPNEKRVKQALLVLDDRSLRPIFVHCLLGKDRNTFIIGLYRVYFQDWTPDAKCVSAS